MAGHLIVALASCFALAVDALGLTQQRPATDRLAWHITNQPWWRKSWTTHGKMSLHRTEAPLDPAQWPHRPNRPWWRAKWAASEQDGDAWGEAKSARSPRFYMDQDLWDSWQKKCPYPNEQHPDRELLRTLENHKWRAHNPKNADVIVIPVLMSDSADGLCGNHRENMLELVGYLERSSAWSRTGGADHMVPGFSWTVMGNMISDMRPYLQNLTVVSQDFDHERRWSFDGEDHDPFDYSKVLIAPYVSAFNRSKPVGRTLFREWAARPYSVNFVGQTSYTSDAYLSLGFTYHGYELRKAAFKSFGDVFPDAFIVCASETRCDEETPQCNANFKPVGCKVDSSLPDYTDRLQNARFGLYTRGDTSSSGHLYDIIDALAIPIIVDDGFFRKGAPFSSIIDWPRFGLFIPEAAFRADPARAVLDAVNIPNKEMNDRFHRVQKAQRCLSWEKDSRRVASVLLAEFAFLEASQSSARASIHQGAICDM